MSDNMVRDILAKRRDRAIAVVLGIKERECDPHLPPEARARLRKTILDQFNDLYDVALDLLRAGGTPESTVANDLYIQKLEGLQRDVGEIRILLESTA